MGRRMEIKFVRKILPVGLVLIALLVGDRPFDRTSNSAWAEPNSSSPSAATAPATPDAKSTAPEPAPTNPDSQNPLTSAPTNPPEENGKSYLPIWLWLMIGALGIWNVALSYLTWRNFSEASKTNHKLSRKLKDLETKDNALDQRINRRSNEINELKGQLSSYKKTLEGVELQSQPKSTKADNYGFDARTKPANYGNHEPSVNQGYDYPSRTGNYGQPTPAVSEPWDSIIQNYNLSPQALESYVIERVSESEESVASRRGNSNAAVFLKAANNYSYWVFTGEDRNYWLTPKRDLKITPMGFDTLQALFECPEYQQGSRIQIIKPAKVAQNSFSGGWDLVEKGQVQFMR
jgi:hypothetical protein